MGFRMSPQGGGVLAWLGGFPALNSMGKDRIIENMGVLPLKGPFCAKRSPFGPQFHAVSRHSPTILKSLGNQEMEAFREGIGKMERNCTACPGDHACVAEREKTSI